MPKRDLGILPEKEFSPEDIRGKFIEGTTHLKRRKESGRKPAHLGVILAIIALLIFSVALFADRQLVFLSPIN